MTQVYVQDGSYLKLREVNLAYNLPEQLHPEALRLQRPLCPAQR